MDIEQKLQELKRRDRMAEEGGGQERRERQHKAGKMSARERIEFLLDENTFEETDRFVTHRTQEFGLSERKYYGDGFITGYGRIDGRLVFVLPRTSPCLAERCRRPTPQRSSRSWKWRRELGP